MSHEIQIDWEKLHRAAQDACQAAYAPYSNFPVGAAGLVDDGRTVTGCNVENASYGLTLCAECGLVSNLALSGGGRLLAVCTVSESGAPCAPCGRCRQLLHEHGGDDCLINGPDSPRRLGDLLPDAFTPDQLNQP